MHPHAGFEQFVYRGGYRCGIALNVRVEFEPFPFDHYGNTVPGHVAVHDDTVARKHGLRSDVQIMIDHAYAGRIHQQATAAALLDYFRVARYELHSGPRRRQSHRTHNRLEQARLESFFQDETSAEILRARARHRQVVHRAVHGQRTDGPPGKQQRLHHVRVGRESNPRISNFEHRRVASPIQFGVMQLREKHPLQQLVHQAAAAAVCQRNHAFSALRNRTRQPVVGARRFAHLPPPSVPAGSTPRYRKYAAHAPSFETIGAPSGRSGVQRVPNAGHSCGFFVP